MDSNNSQAPQTTVKKQKRFSITKFLGAILSLHQMPKDMDRKEIMMERNHHLAPTGGPRLIRVFNQRQKRKRARHETRGRK